MSKSNKIIVVAISVTAALCVAVIAITSFTNSGNDSQGGLVSSTAAVAGSTAVSETAPSQQIETSAITESSAVADVTSASDVTSSVAKGETTAFSDVSTSAAAGTQNLATDIIGKWRDSAGMSGFEFFPDGKASITVFDMNSIGLGDAEVTGTNGVYTIEGNIVTIKYSIYATIEKKYEASVENGVLTMRDVEEGGTKTYTKRDSSAGSSVTTVPSTAVTTTAVSASALEGRFLSADKENELTFNADGTLSIKIKKDTFNGVYQINGAKLVMVYIDDGKSINEEYDFTLNGNILTITSSTGEAGVYIKQ